MGKYGKIVAKGRKRRWQLTGICQRNRLGVNVAKVSSNRGNRHHRNWAHTSDEKGPEVSRALMGSPSDVAQGS